MSKTSNQPAFTSIITQVSKTDDANRSIQLNSTSTIPVIGSTNDDVKSTASRKRRFFSLLLCCVKSSNRNSTKSSRYLPSSDSAAHPELVPLNSELIRHFEAQEKYLLPSPLEQDRSKICLVIDLDETLVHSSFKPVPNADFIVPVEIDGTVHQVYVTKRPHVDEFLRYVGARFECVLFTASLAKYADPVADLLDESRVFHARLFRESCTFYNGNYVKDLSRLGRDLNRVIIIDNSPISYIFHQDNAVPVASWFDDMNDTELLSLIPVFERLAPVDNVIPALKDAHRRQIMK